MDRKKVTAVVRAYRLDDVGNAPQTLGVPGITLTPVKGCGGHANIFRGDWCCSHARVEAYTVHFGTDDILEANPKRAHTDLSGDGIITVRPVEKYCEYARSAPHEPCLNGSRKSSAFSWRTRTAKIRFFSCCYRFKDCMCADLLSSAP